MEYIFSGSAESSASGLVSALAPTRSAQQVANAPAIQTTGGDDAIIDDDAAITAPHCDTAQHSIPNEPRQAIFGLATGRAAQFGRVEVGKADLDPGGRIGAGSDAEAVAVADVADDAREGLAGPVGQSTLARVCMGHGGSGGEEDSSEEPFHGRESEPIRLGREGGVVTFRGEEARHVRLD